MNPLTFINMDAKTILKFRKSDLKIYRQDNISEPSGVHPRNERVVEYSKINQCN